MNWLHSPRVFGYVSQHLLCRVPHAGRRIALTFDDGPNPAATPQLLDLLAAHGMHATFFLIGRNAARYPELAARIAAHGHEIGNHTHDHLVLPVLPQRAMLQQLERAAGAIHEATGERPQLFRPPLGWFTRRMLRGLASRGYVPVLGDVYPQDSRQPGVAVLVQRVLGRVQPGSIVILHDGSVIGAVNRQQTLAALATILPRLQADGFTVGTVGELLAAATAAAGAPGAAGGTLAAGI